jgi:chromatin structure-remodeling complex subunit RSC1/2
MANPVAAPSTAQLAVPDSDQPPNSIEGDTRIDRSKDAKDGEDADAEGDGEADAEDITGGQHPSTESNLTEDQWKSMMDVVLAIYDYREEDGHDPSRLFHRSVNKRYVPDYYDVIKEPVALSILKQRINKREYKNYAQFVRDCALVRTSLWNKLIGYADYLIS